MRCSLTLNSKPESQTPQPLNPKPLDPEAKNPEPQTPKNPKPQRPQTPNPHGRRPLETPISLNEGIFLESYQGSYCTLRYIASLRDIGVAGPLVKAKHEAARRTPPGFRTWGLGFIEFRTQGWALGCRGEDLRFGV